MGKLVSRIAWDDETAGAEPATLTKCKISVVSQHGALPMLRPRRQSPYLAQLSPATSENPIRQGQCDISVLATRLPSKQDKGVRFSHVAQ